MKYVLAILVLILSLQNIMLRQENASLKKALSNSTASATDYYHDWKTCIEGGVR